MLTAPPPWTRPGRSSARRPRIIPVAQKQRRSWMARGQPRWGGQEGSQSGGEGSTRIRAWGYIGIEIWPTRATNSVGCVARAGCRSNRSNATGNTRVTRRACCPRSYISQSCGRNNRSHCRRNQFALTGATNAATDFGPTGTGKTVLAAVSAISSAADAMLAAFSVRLFTSP